MIYVVVSLGKAHGWGVVGSNLTRELCRKTQVRCFTSQLTPDDFATEFEYAFFKSLHVNSPQEIEFLRKANDRYPIVQAFDVDYYEGFFQAPRKIGISVVPVGLPQEKIDKARSYFDVLAAGSEWCRRLLESMGLRSVVVQQGIDPLLFNGGRAEKQIFHDKFVVFSGGKFELKKGQDVVVRAYKVLQDRHRDVMLVTSWFNAWPQYMDTMRWSRNIRYSRRGGEYKEIINNLLHDNGIDLNRVINLPLLPNVYMPQIYQNTDIGIFPNRCEAGTNLVLMEYMACGKPVIATAGTGHGDILTESNCIRIVGSKPLTIREEASPYAVTWEEPNVDETVAHLEWAYTNRGRLKSIGQEAARTLTNFAWETMARKILELAQD